MWGAIATLLQIIYLIFKNKFERDAEKRKVKKELYEESKEAIKSVFADRDIKPLKSVLVKLLNE